MIHSRHRYDAHDQHPVTRSADTRTAGTRANWTGRARRSRRVYVSGMSRIRDNVSINPAALRHIRRITGISVTTLAEETGVTASYISNLEAGRRQAVSPLIYTKLCDTLRITDRRVLLAPLHQNNAA